jgi:hypothetical protein
MTLTFSKATKEQSKLRLALFGPSGSGKTYTALRLASGIGGRVALIDTERGSASKYADRFTFDTLELPQNNIDTYIEGIKAAAGYDVLIIDSLSHAWQELLAEVDKIAKAKYQGNSWSGWSEGTRTQRGFIEALLDYDGHLIATMRSRTEWNVDKDEKTGKIKPTRVGLAPVQGKDIEYEFDLLLELSTEHVANVLKDRTGKYQDKIIEKPGEELGKELAAWLSEGAAATPNYAVLWTNQQEWVIAQLAEIGTNLHDARAALGVKSFTEYKGTPAEGIARLRDLLKVAQS